MKDFITSTISLFFVFNAVGSLSVIIPLIRRHERKVQRKILFREFGVALAILLLFAFFGEAIFRLVGITQETMGIAGGFLLLIIGIGMVFPKNHDYKLPTQDPFIVPIATPILSGPGSIAFVIVYSQRIGNYALTSLSIFVAVAVSFIITLIASHAQHLLGERGLNAVERLGGMILTLIGVQMLTMGVVNLIKANF
ncbi:MAG: MarC family protein [Simkaniaceae bacterium]|nr:MarC family protein [Simkaniaceae bacterium]